MEHGRNLTNCVERTGEYTLVATDSKGCFDTQIVVLKGGGVVIFDYNYACVGGATTFKNDSKIDLAVKSWSWDFGDGGTSNLENPSHIYTASGVYAVILVAEDILGCKISYTLDVIICTPAKYKIDILSDSCVIAANKKCPFYTTMALKQQIGNDPTACRPPALTFWDFGNGNKLLERIC